VQGVNNVPYGGVYFGQWSRLRPHGRIVATKATHDFDYITQLLDSRPVSITAMHSRVAYGGCSRRTWSVALRFTDTCPESPENLTRSQR
jgi:predicted dehydrogenase